jgi:hypothetical protein
VCPECGQYIIYADVPDWKRVYPPDRGWTDFSEHVPSSLLADFNEARKLLDVSPKASAMLSRRCLQRLMQEHLGIKENSLDKQIEFALRSGELPSYLAADLDAVRTVGNFAAHPGKS